MACSTDRFDVNCGGCRHCADCPPTPGAPTYVYPSALADADRRIREADRAASVRGALIRDRANN